ncbi:MAG: IS1 family transposase [Leptolyngbyaceae cyanobacterium bins.302]|nr:IS1 family transposase [Leptolyngbyaceae cyanobacterium bins.302]
MNCVHCQSENVVKNGKASLQDGISLQRYLCQACRRQFNDRTGTPMSRLRTPSSIIAAAVNVRTEGLGMRATGRAFGKSHSTIAQWEERVAQTLEAWSPPAPAGADVTVEGDEVYTRVGENLPPSESEGWTIHFIERQTRYWVNVQAGQKSAELFTQVTQQTWEWTEPATFIRWFTDGERRYGNSLWKLASVYLRAGDVSREYGHRKVWREGLEVAMKIKGSQGHRRVEWVKVEHPFTAISDASEGHANHNEAQNAALRRRSSAYRRRQNLYAKNLKGLQRVLDVQKLVHNWVKPHWGLDKNTTPAMKMGFISRPVLMLELLTSRGFVSFIS